MTQIFPTARWTWAACTLAAILIATTVVAAPANAATDRTTAVGALSAAENALGIHDDSLADDVVVMEAGQHVTVGEGGTELELALGRGMTRARGAAPVYTVDRLDPTTTRIAAVMGSRSDATPEWGFSRGTQLIALPDGRVSVSDAEGVLLAGIATPWAIDATGRQLPTHYEAHGSKLRQIVDVDPATVFPVVADPTFTQFPGYWTARLNRTESVNAVGTVATCAAVFQKAPHPALRALTITCGGLAAFSAAQLAGGKCVTVHVAGIPPLASTWWPTFPHC